MEIIETTASSVQRIVINNSAVQEIAEEDQPLTGRSFQPASVEISKSSFNPNGSEVRINGRICRKDGQIGKNWGYAYYKIGDVPSSNRPDAPQWVHDILSATPDLVGMAGH